ncbi:MAG: hypothetical protein ACKVQR_11845, partial [Aquabacterium sp.]
ICAGGAQSPGQAGQRDRASQLLVELLGLGSGEDEDCNVLPPADRDACVRRQRDRGTPTGR